MESIVQVESLFKSYSAEPLLQDIHCSVQRGDRLGLIGPNGAGKSTLLKIMAGIEELDAGEVRRQRGAFMLYSEQQSAFDPNNTIEEVLGAAWQIDLPDYERAARSDRFLRSLDLDPQQLISSLSGGWQKRVHLISALMQEPDCWFVDEPTNHLDLDAVLWLQQQIIDFKGSVVVISHDRYFLNEIATRVMEINQCFKSGLLNVHGNYDEFVEQRDAYMQAQAQEQSSLANQLRKEQAWLARRPKARTTKSVSRIKRAAVLQDDLSNVAERNKQKKIGDVGFHGSGRRSQDIIVAEGVSLNYDDTVIFTDVDVHLSAGQRLVVLGRNGSGKSSLLRVLAKDLEVPGKIKHAHELRIVRFSQDRSQLDQNQTLSQVLCPEGDRVFYRGRAMHINAWLQLFLFRRDQLDQRIADFSGGEQARILLSRMMLQEADLLILDEPTNDLDIPAIELLEQSLIDFEGAIILVTHDRYLMEQVGTDFLAMELGAIPRRVGSYRQWEGQKVSPAAVEQADADEQQVALSWEEQKELRGIEKRIQKAEERVDALGQELLDPAIAADLARYQALDADYKQAQLLVEDLYSRWQDLEARS